MEGYEAGLTLTPMPLLYERITGRVPVEHVNQNWVVVFPIGGPSVFDVYPLLKRVMDIILALIGLAIFLLMLPFIALAIKLDSSGPIFYMQERTGKAGKPFRVIKLRTMVQDAEKRSGPLWAAKGDPRITTVGRFLRKSRLDEVPQIINVLRGEMSMVGPRPERPKFVEMLSEEIPFYNTRHVIRPGVTGWAQVKYRYGSSTYDSMVKLQYDLYYIRHRSLLLDLLILIRTVRKMLLFQGT
jgi:exopolysaccharide biosynthesis polyprenyl glycosylphosphotransferase